jgi:hypothetical protein
MPPKEKIEAGEKDQDGTDEHERLNDSPLNGRRKIQAQTPDPQEDTQTHGINHFIDHAIFLRRDNHSRSIGKPRILPRVSRFFLIGKAQGIDQSL